MFLLEYLKKKSLFDAINEKSTVGPKFAAQLSSAQLSSAQLSSAHSLFSLNSIFPLKTCTQFIAKNLSLVMIAASLLSVGCDNQVKGGYGAASDEALSPCTNDSVTT